MANQIISEIILDLDKMRAQLKKAESEGKESGDKAGGSFGKGVETGLTRGWGKVVGVVAGLATAIVGAFSLKKMIDEATAGQNSVNSLANAMRAAGVGGIDAANRFNDWAGSMQSVVGIADDVISSNAAMLVSLGKLQGEGLERASKAALDLAAGLNIDVESAFRMVSKAATGHAEVLNRYGFQIRKTGDDSKDFAQALNALEATFGGLAAGKMNTFAGQMTRVELAFNDMFEALGTLIIKSPVVVALLKFVADSFLSAANAVSKFGESGDVVGDLIKQLLEVGRVIVVYVGAPLELLYNTGKMVFYGLATLVSAFISAAITALYGLAAAGALVTDKFKGIRDELGLMREATLAATGDLAGETAKGWENIFNFDATAASENFVAKIQSVADAAKPIAKAAGESIRQAVAEGISGVTFQDVVTAMDDAKNKISVTAQEIAQSINKWIVGSASSAFEAFGGALAKGENAFEAFGKSILKSLGALLIQFGTMLIAVGAGLSTVPFLFGLQGPAAIAAGVAAVVLGGALSALGGGGAGSTASTGGGVSSAGAGGTTGSSGGFDTQDLPEKEKERKSVTIQIQGSYFETEQTRTRLVEMIQEASDATDFSFRSA